MSQNGHLYLVYLLTLLVVACSNSEFEGARSASPARNTPNIIASPQNPNLLTQSFQLTASSGKIDMIWVIDNSGSMDNEAAHVRNNFHSFINTVQQKTDLKLALLSDDQGSTAVTLPQVNQNFLQVPTTVSSRNGLEIAAKASCPQNTSNNQMICGTAIPGLFPFDFDFDGVDARGSLANFLRPDAQRVYVFVTDDDASSVTDANFVNMIAPYNGNRMPTVFSFIGKSDQADCTISRQGRAYESLAAQTQGETFDICEQDWTQHFTKLSQNIEVIANTSFTLAGMPQQVVSVSVDGQVLPANQYTVLQNTVRLQPGVVSPTNQTISIQYLQ